MRKGRADSAPTNAELEILNVLWTQGPSTVRDVYDYLGPSRGTGYTTILKLLQIMTEKGLVVRQEDSRAHVYSPALEQQTTQKSLVTDLAHRLFGGSTAQLAMRALEEKGTTKEELAEIRRMLDALERDGTK